MGRCLHIYKDDSLEMIAGMVDRQLTPSNLDQKERRFSTCGKTGELAAWRDFAVMEGRPLKTKQLHRIRGGTGQTYSTGGELFVTPVQFWHVNFKDARAYWEEMRLELSLLGEKEQWPCWLKTLGRMMSKAKRIWRAACS